MAREGFGKIKYFQKSGARLYIPEKVIGDSSFPFKDGDIVKIRIGNNCLNLESVDWWEMLDWKTMPEAYEKLPAEIKEKIANAGLI